MRSVFLFLAMILSLLCLCGCTSTTQPMEQSSVTIPQPTPKCIVLDPGHQAKANTTSEPIGPGASKAKMKVTGGTVGITTGIPEYELTLTVCQLLRQELTARGYTVVMTRETNDVDLSNRQRAELANQSGGDLFLRLHANGSEDSSVQGAMTLCPTPENPYPIGTQYTQCRLLADCVLDGLTTATGANRQTVWETDTMSGINWCQIPVTIIEMGYLSNHDEDVRLNDPTYQQAIAIGITNGVDQYFLQLKQ